MKKVFFDNPHRQKHFDLFNNMSQPHINVTANVDVTALLARLKARQIAFTTAVLYLACRTANAIPQFRWRIRGTEVVEHELIHPSVTVPTEVSEVFSFCYVDYDPSFSVFSDAFDAAKKQMAQNPSMEDEPGRDDYLFLSAMPWVSFTSIQHAMPYQPTDSVPRIVWGKYFEEQGKIKMPFSVQAHHAVIDGWHIGQYFGLLQDLLDDFKEA